jgi:uncharacterized membrane protein YphA (DoxX/SURF4 family)
MAKTSSGEKAMNKVHLLLRLIISAIFIYASIHKIINPQEFAKQVALYEILPLFTVYPFSYALPFLELICGVLIWIPLTRISANILNILMTVAFIIAITVALILGKDINCGCFGNEDRIGISKLIMDAGLLLIIIYCLRLDLLQEKAILSTQNEAQ